MKSVTLYSTSSCNLRCKHCGVGADQYQPREQQTTEELKKIVRHVAEGGARWITVLGGEATIYRKDLGEVLDCAEEAGIKISINTNLTSFQVVEPLLNKKGLGAMIVSLDGASAATHDSMRGKGTFNKTLTNLKKVTSHPRVGVDLAIELAFVMSGINYKESGRMMHLAVESGATKCNIKNVKMVGRAADFKSELGMGYKEMLDAYCEVIINWMMAKDKIELEVFVPPSFAVYLNRRFGLNFPTAEMPACGGTDVYSYIDLYGNHLPCPAMAYEENLVNGFDRAIPEINLVNATVAETFNTDLFKTFEKNRLDRVHKNQLYPCKFCKFNTQCTQCVSDIIAGKSSDAVDICAAVYNYGNEQVPGIREEIWHRNIEDQNPEAVPFYYANEVHQMDKVIAE